MKEIAAGGVVFKHEGEIIKILLIEDRYQNITIPKGKQELGESLPETALREIREETGIEGEIIQLLDHVTYQYQHPQRGFIDKEVTYYLVECVGGEITVQLEEIEQAFWVELHEVEVVHSRKGYGNNEAIIKQAYHELKKRIYS